MMYYMGQHGPILNQPITSMIVNERPHNCSAGKFLLYEITLNTTEYLGITFNNIQLSSNIQ